MSTYTDTGEVAARAWAAHLETCMDPACLTCARFDVLVHGSTSVPGLGESAR